MQRAKGEFEEIGLKAAHAALLYIFAEYICRYMDSSNKAH